MIRLTAISMFEHHDDHQKPYNRREGRLVEDALGPVQPRHREQQNYEHGRHHDGAEGDQGVGKKT